MTSVRSWRLLAPGELAAMEAALEPMAEAWRQACLPDRLHVQLRGAQWSARAAASSRPADLCISLLDQAGQVCAQLACSHGLLDFVQEEAGLGKPAGGHGAIEANLGRRAVVYLLCDLLSRLARLPAGSARRDSLFSTNHAALDHAHGSCTLALNLQLGMDHTAAHGLQVLLAQGLIAQWCQALPAPRGGLSARQGLADGLVLPYRVLAGTVCLPLSSLAQLEPGDVLRLDRLAEQGLQLESQAGAGLCRAGIGLHEGRAVLQVCGD
jgi:hypothetical protein